MNGDSYRLKQSNFASRNWSERPHSVRKGTVRLTRADWLRCVVLGHLGRSQATIFPWRLVAKGGSSDEAI
jgi:hypothetical protein